MRISLGVRPVIAVLFIAIACSVSPMLPARAQTAPPGCAPGTECILNERTGLTYTSIGAAAAAGQPGDTFDITQGIYFIPWNPSGPIFQVQDQLIDITSTWNCYGDTSPNVMQVEPACIIDPSMGYSAAGIAAGFKDLGLVSSGGIVIAQAGLAPPTVTLNGIEVRNATNGAVTATNSYSCLGQVMDVVGEPTQCSGNAMGGIDLRAGTLFCNSCVLDKDANGFFGEPFVRGTGGAHFANSLIWLDGTGGGQQHGLYFSRFYQGTMINSTVLDVFNGEGFKNRGVNTTITNTNIGDSSCFINHGLPVPAWTPSTTISGNSTAGTGNGMSNEINSPDGGNLTIADDNFCKGTNSSNTAFIESFGGGSVGPWPTPVFSATDDTYYNDAAKSTLIWNPSVDSNITGTGENVVGNTPSWAVFGLGASGYNVTLNGSAWSPPTVDWVPLLQSLTPADVQSFVGTGTPESYTITTDSSVVLGGNGLLTTTEDFSGGYHEVMPGPGGASATFSESQGYFIDAPGDQPSTIVEQDCCGAIFLNATNDTLSIQDCHAGGYIGVAGKDETVNLCPTNLTATVETKDSFGTGPSANFVGTGGENGDLFVDDGGDFELTGTGTNYMEISCAPNSGCPHGWTNFYYNLNWGSLTSSTSWDFTISGQAWWIPASATYTDYTDPTTHNLIYLNGSGGPWQGTAQTLINSTVDAGVGTGDDFGDKGATQAGSDTMGIVVGSGSINVDVGASKIFTFDSTTAPDAIFEVAPAGATGIHGGYTGSITGIHTSGGSVTLTSFTANSVGQVFFEGVGGETLNCAPSTHDLVLTASDGSAITVTDDDAKGAYLYPGTTCASLKLNTLVPVGMNGSPNDITLSGTGINGQTGSPLPAPVILTDPWAQATSGEVYVTVQDIGGQVVFNGTTASAGGAVAMLGRESDVAAALDSLQDILGAGSTQIIVEYWNQGGGTSTLDVPISTSLPSTAVACAQGILVAPLSPGQLVCPIVVSPEGWVGTLTLGGPGASGFSISGSNLLTSSTPPTAGQTSITITATP